MINVAVIGTGHWGKNLARNFNQLPGSTLKYICDKTPSIRETMAELYPETTVTEHYDEVLADDSVDAVVIAVDAPLHFELGRQAIEAGKHTFIEKPMTLSSADSDELVRLAGEKGVKLMVGHLLEYHPCVELMKKVVDEKLVGETRYLYFQRLNLGIVRSKENAWWSLAPHDISVACYLLGADPISITCSGHAYLQEGVEDVVFATLKFADGRMANIHVSWLDPTKTRKVTLVGSEKMAIFDDMEQVEKIRIHDKTTKQDEATGSISVVNGEVSAPEIPQGEPLATECQHFLDAIENDTTPRSDGLDGLRVVKILEAGSESLKRDGALVEI